MLDIVVDARTMGSQPSGVGFYLFDFLKELIKSEKLKITLLTDVEDSEQMRYMIQQNIPVICFGKRIFRSASIYSYFKFVKTYLCREQPAVFWEPNNLLPIRLKGFSGKIILTIHDLFPISTPEYFSFIYRCYFRIGVKKSIKAADNLLFDSMETRDLVMHYFPAAKAKQSFVTYLIVSSTQHHHPCNDGYFLYIGNLERRKGSDLLLKAYEKYCEAGGKMPLFLGGRIREKKIGKLLKGTSDKCPALKYLGYLAQKEKEKLLSNCSCFVFPSKAEGFGLPPLEAMKYGKPVIVSNLSIFDEVLSGKVITFDVSGTEENQISHLGAVMQTVSTLWTCPSYDDVLAKYEPRLLSGRLEAFLLQMEETIEDSI